MFRLLCCVIIFLPGHIYAINKPHKERIKTFEKAALVARSFYLKYRLPSLSVTVATKYTIMYTINFGVSSLKDLKPASSDTPFRIASVSKFIAAISTLKLIQDHPTLNLNKSIYPYVYHNLGSKIPMYLKTISIDNLLTHTSGIRHYDSKHYQREKTYNGIINSRRDSILVNNAILEPPAFKPGTKYLYSTYAINLVQDFIEQEAKESYPRYLYHQFIMPLKLNNFGTSIKQLSHSLATPYLLKNNRRYQAPNVNLKWKLAGGGLLSSTRDLMFIIQALTSGKILKKAMFEYMMTENPHNIAGNNYGRGIHILSHVHGRKLLAHGGWATGGAAYILFDSDGRLILTAATNGQIPSKRLGRLLLHLYKQQNEAMN